MRTSDVSPLAKAQVEFVLLRSSVPAGRVQLILRSGLTRCPEPPTTASVEASPARTGAQTRARLQPAKCSQCAFSLPMSPMYIYDSIKAALHGMEEVIGSIPIRSTKSLKRLEPLPEEIAHPIGN